MLRKFLILPTFVLGFLAIANFLQGDMFFFFVWLFLAMLYFVSTYPLVTDMTEKNAPVFHIFVSLLFLIFFASSIATLDFHKAGFPMIQSFLYGLTIGVLLVIIITLLKGKK